jgi:DNA-binding SARP family transcriptional activator
VPRDEITVRDRCSREVREKSAAGTREVRVIRYTVLGPVTAQSGDRSACLEPKSRLLLAVLVMAAGKPVPRYRLAEILGALRAAVPATGDRDPVPGRHEAYSLPLGEEQADVLRFRAGVRVAQTAAEDSERVRLMRLATAEWGSAATGLFGGRAFGELTGDWADGERDVLREEYCQARLACLRQDVLDRRYESVAGQCRQMAADPDALRKEEFVEYWMIAAYRARDRVTSERAYLRAAEAYRDWGIALPARLHRLAQIIRTEDSQLDGPEGPLAWTFDDHIEKPHTPGRPVSEDKVTIHFHNANARIDYQTGYVDHLETVVAPEQAPPGPEPAESPAAGSPPDGTDDE